MTPINQRTRQMRAAVRGAQSKRPKRQRPRHSVQTDPGSARQSDEPMIGKQMQVIEGA
ncbi:hypothetical protein [Rhodopseudomonas parapalustris]